MVPYLEYDCPVDGCDVAYKHYTSLERHITSAHPRDEDIGIHFMLQPDESHKCPIEGCESVLSRRDVLRKHVRMVHKIDEDDSRYPSTLQRKRRLIDPLLVVEVAMSENEDETKKVEDRYFDQNNDNEDEMDEIDQDNILAKKVEVRLRKICARDYGYFNDNMLAKKVEVRLRKICTKDYENSENDSETFFKDWFIDEDGRVQRMGQQEIEVGLMDPEFRSHFQTLKNKGGKCRDDNQVLQMLKMMVRRAKHYVGKAKRKEPEELRGVYMPKRGLPDCFREDFGKLFEGKSSTTVKEVLGIAHVDKNFEAQWCFLLRHKENKPTKAVKVINMFLKGIPTAKISKEIRQTIGKKLGNETLTMDSMKRLAQSDPEFNDAWRFFVDRSKSERRAADSIRKIFYREEKTKI